jgi:uncharacterized protein
MRKRVFFLTCVIFSFAAVAAKAAGIPEPPADSKFVQDYAGVIPSAVRDSIGAIQARAFNDHDTPIIVVTIRQMADYGYAGSSIEAFATDWFNKWQIGKRGSSGLINRGILLIVSLGDRKARIELGADWGRGWDDHCAGIMIEKIVPQFKNGKFADGILSGVTALGEMVSQGPAATPTASAAPGPLQRLDGPHPVTTSPLPGRLILAITAVGAGLILLSFFVPNARRPLLIAGISIIAMAWLFWIALFAVALFTKSRGRSSGGGFSGGGFSTGGFSGGGGASGSW